MSALSFDDTAAQQQVIDKKAFICPTQIAKKGDTKSAPKGIETLVPVLRRLWFMLDSD